MPPLHINSLTLKIKMGEQLPYFDPKQFNWTVNGRGHIESFDRAASVIDGIVRKKDLFSNISGRGRGSLLLEL